MTVNNISAVQLCSILWSWYCPFKSIKLQLSPWKLCYSLIKGSVSGDFRCTPLFLFEYIGEIEIGNSLACLSGGPAGFESSKKLKSKISWHTPVKSYMVLYKVHFMTVNTVSKVQLEQPAAAPLIIIHSILPIFICTQRERDRECAGCRGTPFKSNFPPFSGCKKLLILLYTYITNYERILILLTS